MNPHSHPQHMELWRIYFWLIANFNFFLNLISLQICVKWQYSIDCSFLVWVAITEQVFLFGFAVTVTHPTSARSISPQCSWECTSHILRLSSPHFNQSLITFKWKILNSTHMSLCHFLKICVCPHNGPLMLYVSAGSTLWVSGSHFL